MKNTKRKTKKSRKQQVINKSKIDILTDGLVVGMTLSLALVLPIVLLILSILFLIGGL